jgi:hypothetical protein
MADLRTSEAELDELADVLDGARVPTTPLYLPTLLAMGHRARSFFHGARDVFNGSAPIVAEALIRPALEINLAIRFLSKEPDLHVELWLAKADTERMAMHHDIRQKPVLRSKYGGVLLDQTTLTALELRVKLAHDKGVAAGLPIGKKDRDVWPGLVQLVDWLKDPGATDAYLTYRYPSSVTHTTEHAFRSGTFVSDVHGTTSYSDAIDPKLFVATRTLSLTMFASTMAMVSLNLGLGIQDKVTAIKDAFM